MGRKPPSWCKCGDPHCMLGYANVRRGCHYEGHTGYVSPRSKGRIEAVGFIKKPVVAAKQGAPAPTDDAFAKALPALYEYLTLDRWEDSGAPRTRATLLVLFEDGVWKFCLNDRENARSGWQASQGFQEGLRALSDALADDSIAWRAKPAEPPRGSHRKRS